MIVLDGTRYLTISGGIASHETHCTSSWVNIAAAADTPGHSGLTWVNNGTRTLVPAPAASEQRVVKNISVRVTTGAGVPVTVGVHDGTGLRPLFSATLSEGESLVYEDGAGFAKYTATGAKVVTTPEAAVAPALSQIVTTFNQSSLSSMIAGAEGSLWRASGFPVAGAIPTAAAYCNNTLAGAMPLAYRSGTQKRRISEFLLMGSTAGQTVFLEDRLAHMGGLSGVVTTAQTVGIDLGGTGSPNMGERVGLSGNNPYQGVDWFLEWYTPTGAVVSTPTVNVTYADGTGGTTNAIWVGGSSALPATVAASRRYQIISATGKAIRSVNSVTLSASTGTAGNFGVTAVKRLATVVTQVANKMEVVMFARESAPLVPDSACLTLSFLTTATSSGVFVGRFVQEVAEA